MSIHRFTLKNIYLSQLKSLWQTQSTQKYKKRYDWIIIYSRYRRFFFSSWLIINCYSSTPVCFLRSNRYISAHWCTLPENPADHTFWFRKTLRPSKSTVLSSATSVDHRNRPENFVENTICEERPRVDGTILIIIIII